MSRIFGLGETVLDIIFKHRQPVASRPGGPAVNGLLSLARAGHETHLLSELGEDVVGNTIVSVLHENGVDTSRVYRFSGGKTTVALAFLDEHNNAQLQAYRDLPQVRFQITPPEFQSGDIVIFGSSFAVTPSVRPQVREVVRKAGEQGAYILYDPNLRPHHVPHMDTLRPNVKENFALAHLVRGSDEDFRTIYPDLSTEEVLERLASYGCEAIITANARGADCLLSGQRVHVEAPDIAPVSTVGAGDNFNAGLAHGLAGQRLQCDDAACWRAIVEVALRFSTDVCMSLDNCISFELASSL